MAKGVGLSYTFCWIYPLVSPYFRIGNVQGLCSFVPNAGGKCRENVKNNHRILHQSTILHLILHPILHPKSLVNTTGFADGCRKCSFFSETFFQGGGREARSGSCKTSDFFDRKYGCFAWKVRRFASKKSDVFIFRKGASRIANT